MANILLVDDEEQMRELLKFILEEVGHTVREAGDGKEALESCRNNPAELVVTDIVMPNKEGTETILELRRSYPGIKILAMSGGGRNNPQDYLKLARTFGADMTLAKPFTNEEFLSAVNTVLET